MSDRRLRAIWLVDNTSSGSHDNTMLGTLEETFAKAGLRVAYRTQFPRFDLPTPAMLDAAGIETVAVFAGDGTINAVVTHLSGWSGAVLVLPGGTMNLFYHRLHGDAEMGEVIRAAAQGRARRIRPPVVRGDSWNALAGLMAGPGTSWNTVREAMRDHSVIAMAGETARAFEETLGGPMVACIKPALGRPEGYPLILLSPQEDGIVAEAYHADGTGEFLEQVFALMKRDFRKGPHDELGRTTRLSLASTDGMPFGMLVDGEPAEAPAGETHFMLGTTEVDLLSTIG